MSSPTKLHITKIEDNEGHGRCGQCDREGLRWIVVLSDGTSVGTECAKSVLGINVKPAAYNWMDDFEPVAEHVTKWETIVLYRSKVGAQTRVTVNGRLQCVGGGEAMFARLTA